MYKNDAAGWYTDARTASGCGTRGDYYDLPIQTLRLTDDSGNFAQYRLNAGYAGRTLEVL